MPYPVSRQGGADRVGMDGDVGLQLSFLIHKIQQQINFFISSMIYELFQHYASILKTWHGILRIYLKKKKKKKAISQFILTCNWIWIDFEQISTIWNDTAVIVHLQGTRASGMFQADVHARMEFAFMLYAFAKEGECGVWEQKRKTTGGKTRAASCFGGGLVSGIFCPLLIVVQGGASCCIYSQSQTGGAISRRIYSIYMLHHIVVNVM